MAPSHPGPFACRSLEETRSALPPVSLNHNTLQCFVLSLPSVDARPPSQTA